MIKGDYNEYYKVIRLIGNGHFGKVFEGKHKVTNDIRAIKVIDIINEETELKDINNEIKNMKICSGNNINSVKIYECYRYKNNLRNEVSIIMELCDNNLQNILDKRGKGFTCEEIYNIMSQLNNTFRIMYKNDIMHRDIKLANIVVKMNNENPNLNFIAKLTDYGISKQLMNTKGKTQGKGTIFTMAPEILKEGKDYDNKCDLWSIGIIMYQLYFNEYPFKGATQVAIYNQIKNKGNKILRKTKNKNLDNLINRLLTIEPKERISYEEYFDHPFFNENNNKYDDSIHTLPFTKENCMKILQEYFIFKEGDLEKCANAVYNILKQNIHKK